MVRRSLTFKAVIFNVAIFWALSFLVISVAVFHFIRVDIDSKQLATENNAVRIADCVVSDQEDVLRTVRLFALPPRVMPAKVEQGHRPDELDSLLTLNFQTFKDVQNVKFVTV